MVDFAVEASEASYLDPKVNWGAEAWRAPTPDNGDTVVYSECGRIFDNVDYRSHWLMLVKTGTHGGYSVLVHHGGGQERVFLGFRKRYEAIFANLSSDDRYFMLYSYLNVRREAAEKAREATAKEYRTAFVEGRLKKRKLRGKDLVKVSISTF